MSRTHHGRAPTGATRKAKSFHRRTRTHAKRRASIARLLAADQSANASGGPGSSSNSTNLSALTFDGTFNNSSVAAWTNGGGGVQCANYGTPSKSPRLRGTFGYDSSNAGTGTASGVFTLPVDSSPSTYPLEACDLLTRSLPNTLGADQYYGIMVYVPSGWSIANRFFGGVEIEEYHFQNIYGAPISLQLHPNHLTIALETGGCSNNGPATSGCQFRSNADNTWCRSTSTHTCLPGYYGIPPGAFVQGAWNELIMHIHWAADSTGSLQAWYRVKGQTAWTPSASFSGIPTVQWNHSSGCCYAGYVDETEAYTAALTAPLSVWMNNVVSGPSFAAVSSTMP